MSWLDAGNQGQDTFSNMFGGHNIGGSAGVNFGTQSSGSAPILNDNTVLLSTAILSISILLFALNKPKRKR